MILIVIYLNKILAHMKDLSNISVSPYLTAAEVKANKKHLTRILQHDTALERLYKEPNLLRIFKKYVDPDKRTLDAGAGAGLFLKLYPGSYATDIDNYLFKDIGDRFRAADFNFDRLPWNDGFFEQIVSTEVVEHLENPFHFFRELHRVLALNGILIISTPNPEHIWNKIAFLKNGEFYRFLRGNNHIMLYCDPIIQKGVRPYFEIVETTYTHGVLPYRFFSRMKFPSNKRFGHSIIHVLKRK